MWEMKAKCLRGRSWNFGAFEFGILWRFEFGWGRNLTRGGLCICRAWGGIGRGATNRDTESRDMLVGCHAVRGDMLANG